MADEFKKLAAGFPAPDEATWLARAEKALGGASVEEALSWRRSDGMKIRPLYRRRDLPEGADSSGFPGFAPCVRSSRADGRGWEIRQRHAHPDPEIANRQILKDLERGVMGLVLTLDPEGRRGTVVRSKADLARLLDGVDLALAPVTLDAGINATAAAAMLLALWREQGIEPAAASGHLGLDPLASLAGVGRLGASVETSLEEMGSLAVHLTERWPNVSAAMVSTRAYHSAGASEAQELGAMLATAVAYLRAMETAGLTLDAAAGRIAFTLTADADLPLTIAKLRAARALWTRVLAACGVSTPSSMHLAAETAARLLSRRDPWVNILRATTAAFAAAAAGVEAITVDPHDAALGVPSDFARRIARNAQAILAEESHLGRVIDPAGGAYAFESLTRELAEQGWAEFQRIEGEGGMAASLAAGAIQDRIGEVWKRRAKVIARREEPVIGVSEYPDLGEAPLDMERPDPAPLRETAQARASRARPVDRSWPDLVKAAREGAAIEALSGEDEAAAEIDPLPAHRLAEAFEALRDRSDAILAETGARPRIFLACLGLLAEHTARATWARNLYAAGGIEAVAGSGGTDMDAIVAAWRESGADEAVLCGSDAAYEAHAEALAPALARAGAAHIALLGKPGEREADWRSAGIESFVHRGIDCVTLLEAVYRRMGETR